MSQLTYAELFAGAGGLSMGLELAGWEPVAHAEIEPHARAILRHHWPECRLDGDVSAINGADYAGVTLLSGGSPCQDLSIAGKRNGMTEGSGTRSSLYFEQVRIWNESGAPYFLWENVLGAFSSNNGRDFAAVLSALVGAAVPVPSDGWESAGVAAGPTGVAAWRVLDCQYFGPPQRRRRVFVLGTRTGGVDPAEVLAVSEGVRGDSATSEQAREGAAGSTGNSTTLAWDDECNAERGVAGPLNIGSGGSGTRRDGVMMLRNREGKPGGGKRPLLSEEKSLTLQVANDQVVFAQAQTYRMTAFGEYADDGTASTIKARDGKDATDLAVSSGIPRRLMPVECERLMGWPDQHTATGVDEQGRTYALSDTARYRLCGNGVASPVAGWIAWRLRWAIEGQLTPVAEAA